MPADGPGDTRRRGQGTLASTAWLSSLLRHARAGEGAVNVARAHPEIDAGRPRAEGEAIDAAVRRRAVGGGRVPHLGLPARQARRVESQRADTIGDVRIDEIQAGVADLR